MKPVKLPQISYRDVFDSCIKGMQRGDVRDRLEAASGALNQCAAQYRHFASFAYMHAIRKLDEESAFKYLKAYKSDLKKLYSNRLSSRNTQSRKFYDLLKLGDGSGICPVCQRGVVSDLDHHLPRSRYPQFAITPENLVPICRDCNDKKFTHAPIRRTDQILHPYFDREPYLTGKWLFAHVEDFRSVRYEACPPKSWPSRCRERVKKHFEVYQLNRRLSVFAADQLNDIRNTLLAQSLGQPEEIKEYFRRLYRKSISDGENHWRTALYKTLSEFNGNLKNIFLLEINCNKT